MGGIATEPVQTDAVVASVALLIAIPAIGLLLPTFDFSIFAWPDIVSMILYYTAAPGVYQQPFRLRVLGSAPPAFLGRGIFPGDFL